MLDAQELAKRLRAAMDLREPPLASIELAAKCGVTKQAVYEWRTTGRMGKTHLITVAQETGMPLEFFLEPKRGQSDATRVIWRRLGRAFAKVAAVVLIATYALLSPSPAQAHDFVAAQPECVLCQILRRAIARLMVRLLTGKSHGVNNHLMLA